MALVNKYCNPTGAGLHDGSTPGDAWSFVEAIAGYAAGNIVNVLAGTGNTYDGTTNVRTLATAGTTGSPVWWRGYKATPGDQDNNANAVAGVDIPQLTFTTGGLNPGGSFQIFSNLDVSGASTAGSFRLFNASSMANSRIYRCRFRLLAGATVACANLAGGNIGVFGCYFSSAVAQPLVQSLTGTGQLFMGNYFTGGSVGLAYSTGQGNFVGYNLFDGVQGDAIQFTTGYASVVGNIIYAPTGHGITWSGTPTAGCHVANNHFENVNVALKAAINNASGTPSMLIDTIDNSFFQCTANIAGQGDVPNIWDNGTLAGSGCVNAAGHDFTPSALLLARGFPGQFENTSIRGYMNLGALQSQASAGGGGYLVGGGLVR